MQHLWSLGDDWRMVSRWTGWPSGCCSNSNSRTVCSLEFDLTKSIINKWKISLSSTSLRTALTLLCLMNFTNCCMVWSLYLVLLSEGDGLNLLCIVRHFWSNESISLAFQMANLLSKHLRYSSVFEHAYGFL